LAAEIENTKKCFAWNSSQTIEQMLDRHLLDVLPFTDNLERILSNQSGGDHGSQLVDGVCLTFREFKIP